MLATDLERLDKLAFNRRQWCGLLVERYHALHGHVADRQSVALLDNLYAWLFMPLTLWAVNIHDLLGRVLSQIEDGEPLGAELRCLLQSLQPVPAQDVQAIIANHEMVVQKGDYAVQVKASAKFDTREQELVENSTFQEEWAALKGMFDLSFWQDYKGVIRRSVVSERGFRPSWEFAVSDAEFLFSATFDLFCQKWDLYGMQHDRPLLQRLTVNLTPNGTMIFIPAWWSLDGKRDLNWSEIQALHGARVTSRQGEKLSVNQVAQRKEAAKAFKLNELAKTRGLRGDERIRWVSQKMKWQGESARKLGRALKRAKEMGLT